MPRWNCLRRAHTTSKNVPSSVRSSALQRIAQVFSEKRTTAAYLARTFAS
jgi:hypothetical protein